MGTASSLEAPPCTPVLPIVCRRRSSLLPRGNTRSGSVAPSWLPSPPSRRCGSPSRSTMRPDQELSTGNASRKFFWFSFIYFVIHGKIVFYVSTFFLCHPTALLTLLT